MDSNAYVIADPAGNNDGHRHCCANYDRSCTHIAGIGQVGEIHYAASWSCEQLTADLRQQRGFYSRLACLQLDF
jgi:hypothetical protein